MGIVFLLSIFFFSVVSASKSNLTKTVEDTTRKQLLNALRTEVKRMHGLDVVFVVKGLKVKNKWAWVHTLPQSRDGHNRYEDISALLHLEKGKWTVVEIPCTEPENPECIDAPGYFKNLRKKYPDISLEILPVE